MRKTTAHAVRSLYGAASLLILATLVVATPAEAQDAKAVQTVAAGTTSLEELVVTARRREENAQTVPVDVNVVTQAELDRHNTNDAAELVQLVPGLQENAFTDRSNVDFAIRGQTHTYGTLAPAVVTYLAQVPLPRVSEGLFYDLDNMQVLKGPQGTLFGRVTDGGDILLEPKKPGNSYGGYAEIKGGNYNLVQFQGAVDLPVIADKVLLRVATNIVRRDGYTTNLLDGRKLDDVNENAFRASLILRPFDHFENYTVVDYTETNENGSASVLIGYNPADYTPALVPGEDAALVAQQQRGPRVVNLGTPGYFHDGTYSILHAITVANHTSYEFSDALTVRNIFGFSNYKDDIGNGSEGGIPALGNLGLGTKYPIFFNYRRLISDELQAQGALFDKRLNYTVGLYTERENTPGLADQFAVISSGPLIIQASVIQYATTQSHAAYAQISYDLRDVLPGLKLDLGGRYSEDQVKSDNAQYLKIGNNPLGGLPTDGQCLSAAQVAAQFPGTIVSTPCTHSDAKFDADTYTAGLSYTLDHTFLYATMRRGYRPGGFNATSGGNITPAFGPEFSLSKEIGVKSDWTWGGVSGRTNLIGFWDRITATQQYVSNLANGAVSTGVVNGAAQDIKGFEFEGVLVPVKNLQLSATWAYTEGEFEKDGYPAAMIAASCPANPYTTAAAANGLVCPLQHINNLPKNVLTVAARYTWPLGERGDLSVGGDWYHTSSQSPGNVSSLLFPIPTAPDGGAIPGYDVVNLNAVWSHIYGRPITITAFVNNVADRAYIQNVTNYTQASSLGAQWAIYAPPRMYGLSLRYDF